MKSTRAKFITLHVTVLLVSIGLLTAIAHITLDRGASDRISIAPFELFIILLVVFGIAVLITRGVGVIVRCILKRKRPSRLGALLIACNVMLVAGLAYARFIEPFWIRVERVKIHTQKVKAPFRIVLISDLHSDSRFDLDQRTAALVNAQEADLVIFAGDSLNVGDRLEHFRAALTSMRAKVGKLAIRGNWDVWFWSKLNLFEGTGFEELNGWRTFDTLGGPLYIGGAHWLDAWNPEAIFGSVPVDGMRVFAYHANDYLEVAREKGIDLYFCGDTHGGQLALPLYGALYSIGRLGRRYARGLYERSDMRAFVTPGLGVERGFPLRFGVRPEVSVIDLLPVQ